MIANSTQRPDAWRDLIPNHWKSDRLSKFADIIVSNVDKKTEDGEDLVLLCNYVDVYKNDRITADIPFMEASATPHEIAKFTLHRDDVITTKDSENPLDIAIPSLVAEDIEDVLCGYHLAIVRSEKRHLFGPYLSWLHVSQTIRAHYEMHATGITRWAIGRKHFKTCPIPLPPLHEQKRIAAYLDASCAAIDRAVETKQKQLETLDALRKSIIQRAVTQGLNPKAKMKDSGVEWLGRVPEHWKRRTIKRVCEFSPTYSQGKPEAHEACTFVPMASVSTLGVIDISDVKPMSDITAGLNLFENGDVIFAKITPCMENGKGAVIRNLITHFAYGSTEFHVMRPNHAIIADYLYFYLHNKVFREWAEKNMHGAAGQQRVGTKFLKYTYIFIPTEDEQIEIIKYVRQRLEEITSIEENVSRQIATLTAYRKSLIHECVTGKRRISDSDVAKVEAHV